MPNSAFGILSALAAAGFSIDCPQPNWEQVLFRSPVVVAFNWYSVLIFTLANQRRPESIQEDAINKPWRPVPSNRVQPELVRKAMLVLIPLSMALNYSIGLWQEGLMIQVLTWMYNDLRAGDELIRDAVTAVAYGFFNLASLKIAQGPNYHISTPGYLWILTVSGVILTTMQIQDLKDQEGDRTRLRKTIPLVFGETFSRVTIAAFTCVWTELAVKFWKLGWLDAIATRTIALTLVGRVLNKKGVGEDRNNWKLWCFWTVSLYSMPLISHQ